MKRILLLLCCCAALGASAASIRIWSEPGDPAARAIEAALVRNGHRTVIGTEAGLTGCDVLIVAPGCRFPEARRGELRPFFAAGGVLAVTGPENFGVPGAPDRSRQLLLADWDTRVEEPNYRVRGNSRVTSLVHVAERGERFLTIETPYFRVGSVFVELIHIAGKVRPDDRYLCFNALGGADSDLLTVVVTNRAGRQFVGYADLTRTPRDVAIRFADLMALPSKLSAYFDFGGQHDHQGGNTLRGEDVEPATANEIRLDPASIKNISIGLSRRHLWWDKGGSLRLGAVYAAPSTAPADTGLRGGEAAEYRVPYAAVGMTQLPDSVFDPMNGAAPAAGAELALTPDAARLFGLGPRSLSAPGAVTVPPPSKVRGREPDDKSFPAFILSRSDRRIPLLTDAAGAAAAEIRFPGNDTAEAPVLLRFGLPKALYTDRSEAVDLLARAVDIAVARPRIVEIMPNHEGDHPVLEIRLENPGKTPLRGALRAEIAGLPPAALDVTLPPGRTPVKLPLAAIPETFDWKHVAWSVALETEAGNDRWQDTAELDRTIDYLAARLLALAKTHTDGRFSHHYFSDVYAARALAFLGAELDRPAWTMAARKMMDSLVSRQGPEGGFPMGYGEEKRIFWVADNGTAAMGVVDFAHRFPDLRESYLAAARRYYDWRETFRMDDERIAKLHREFGEKAPHIARGYFGIGYNDGAFYEKQKFAETVRVERGELWVNGISLLSLPGYWSLTGDRDILAIAERDLRNYLPWQKTENYFGAETVFQCWRHLPDPELREKTKEHFIRAFLDPITAPLPAETIYDKGGRRTLDMLSVVYALRYIESSPRLRATLFQHVMLTGSPTLPGSVFRVGALFDHSTHGNSIAAARYAGSLTLIWLTELGWPDATLLPTASR